MVPQLVTVGLRRRDGRRTRLYVPVVPVLTVLSPLLLPAVAAGLVACPAVRVSPAAALRGIGQPLWALPGTRIEIARGRTAVPVSVR
ncbi:hypothetical protein GCM10010182_62770 [Actinomadura cremea]|nr:hypothetical protein GCM10010182_62770 [Actinomadura cremea]